MATERRALVRAAVQAWSREHQRSWLEGKACAACGRDFAPGETVYVRPATLPVWDVQAVRVGCPSRRRIRLAPHCAACSPDEVQRITAWNADERSARYGPWERLPCAGCGRPIVEAIGFRGRAIHACSKICWQVGRAQARRVAQPLQPHAGCAACGRPFVARERARYCSPACRQRGYRQRQQHESLASMNSH